MSAVKTVQFRHSYPMDDLLDAFRKMVNEAVRIAVKNRITSRFRLIRTVYEDLDTVCTRITSSVPAR